MSDAPARFAPPRIVVALDASPGSLAALRLAGELAGRLRAGLVGLFVEDIQLLRAAQLPLASQVMLASGTPAALEVDAVETQLRLLAQQAAEALLAAAREARVDGGFTILRGSVAAELAAACAAGDLLIVGWASRPAAPATRLGRTARSVAARAAASVLLLPPGPRASGAVCALVDRAGGRPALAAAATLARALAAPLLVAAAASTREAALEMASESAFCQEPEAGPERLLPIAPVEAGHVAAALGAHAVRLLAIDARSPLAQGAALERLIEPLRCAVLLVR